MKTAEKVLGLAALTAIGTYFLTGKRGTENRDKIYGWMLKMKGEVLEKVEDLKHLTKEDYYRIIDETAARYGNLERVSASELRHLTSEMKNAWEHVSKQLE